VAGVDAGCVLTGVVDLDAIGDWTYEGGVGYSVCPSGLAMELELSVASVVSVARPIPAEVSRVEDVDVGLLQKTV